MKPDNYICPNSNVSELGLMTRILPNGDIETGYLTVDPKTGRVNWVPNWPQKKAEDGIGPDAS